MRIIDADALEEKAKQYSLGYYEADEWAVPLCEISEAPSIDIEPKRGEWLEWIDCEGEVFWKCSACGQASEASVAGILYKFCPFCGADMRKGADNE
jgi:hypothetical protein